MAKKATAAMASAVTSCVKCSSKSRTLKTMLTIGSTMTNSGWDTRSGQRATQLDEQRSDESTYSHGVDGPARQHAHESVLIERGSGALDERGLKCPHRSGRGSEERCTTNRGAAQGQEVKMAAAPPNTANADAHACDEGVGLHLVARPWRRTRRCQRT